MSGARQYPHTKRAKPDGPWFAYLAIPLKLRPAFNGAKQFQQSTQEKNRARAFAIAQPLVAAWRQRLVEAKKTMRDPVQAELDHLAAKLRDAASDPAKAKIIEFSEILDAAFRLGGATNVMQRQALIASDGDVEQALRGVPEPSRAIQAHELMTGRVTPFLTHIEGWKADTRLRGGQLKTAITHINLFAREVSEPIEALQPEHVQAWVNAALRRGDKPNTVANRKINLNNYWTWMVSLGLAPKQSKPFDGIKVIDRRTVAEKSRDKWLPFEAADVVRLYDAASPDEPLQNAIRISMFSGIRREVVGCLHRTQVKLDSSIPHFDIKDDKTEAGIRLVPIHSEILERVRRLYHDADADGFLIHCTADDRADAVGKRFGRLKTRLGFDRQHNLHSIRKTVIRLLVEARVSLSTIKNLVGHEDNDITTGVYAGVCSLEEKVEALEKVRYPAA